MTTEYSSLFLQTISTLALKFNSRGSWLDPRTNNNCWILQAFFVKSVCGKIVKNYNSTITRAIPHSHDLDKGRVLFWGKVDLFGMTFPTGFCMEKYFLIYEIIVIFILSH